MMKDLETDAARVAAIFHTRLRRNISVLARARPNVHSVHRRDFCSPKLK